MAATPSATLLECHDPHAFLRVVAGGSRFPSLKTDSFLRGVWIPGEGATFQLRDAFGTAIDEILRISDERARDLLARCRW